MSEFRCPTCDRSVSPENSASFPFCSLRCRMIDLGRWLGEQYSVTVEKEPDDGDDDGGDQDDAG